MICEQIPPMSELDEYDLRILRELQRNARISNVELAKRVGLSPSPCHRRVRRLEEENFFSGYVSLLRPEKLGLGLNIFVQVSLPSQDNDLLNAFEAKVREWPEVMECYLMTGEADYHLRVVAKNMEMFEAFLRNKLTKAMGAGGHIRSSVAFRPVKDKTELPL